MSAARTAHYMSVHMESGNATVNRDDWRVVARMPKRGPDSTLPTAEDIAHALNLAAALPSVRWALELAEATYSNLSSAEFAVGDDKPAREALRSALAALDAAGAA